MCQQVWWKEHRPDQTTEEGRRQDKQEARHTTETTERETRSWQKETRPLLYSRGGGGLGWPWQRQKKAKQVKQSGIQNLFTTDHNYHVSRLSENNYLFLPLAIKTNN